MILADTPVWIDHLASPIPALVERLNAGVIRIHPFVIGEVLLGNLSNPERVRGMLSFLQKVDVASTDEVLLAIQRHDLSGAGVGYVDAHLLVSTLLSPPCVLWTRDKRLRAVADRLGVSADLD